MFFARFVIIFLLRFNAGFKKILGFKLVGFHNIRTKNMLGFRSEATRFENFFKKIFGLVTRFGVIVFLQKNTRFFYLTFFSFSKSIWFRLVGFF